MAKFLPILGQLRGSIGGLVFSRNGGGQYAKSKGEPTNGNTTRQQAARGFLNTLSAGWASLSAANKTAWNGWADTHPRNDSLGQEYTITGHQAYVGLNSRLLDAGESAVATPPAITAPAAPTGVVVTFTDETTISVAFTNTLDTDEKLCVFCSLPQVGGGDPNLAQCRLVGYSASAQATPASMTIPFAVATGNTMNFFVGVLDEAGQLSVMVKDRETKA